VRQYLLLGVLRAPRGNTGATPGVEENRKATMALFRNCINVLVAIPQLAFASSSRLRMAAP
jgi:hypothetical protein